MEEASQKPLPEVRFARQLAALGARDARPRPAGWALSPRAVVDFIAGLADPLPHPVDGEAVEIDRKFVGDDALIERSVITLTTLRGLLLVGEPGTAKSMLSELMAAAISGDSTLTVQGSAATTEEQIRYGWNYALLLARGPCPEALVPGPLLRGMREGRLVRFEEITRCPPEVQDCLLSTLSERIMMIPELSGPERVVQARPGFNLLATANTRDRGVNDMSAALKRRFNFETVHPIKRLETEVDLVIRQTNRALDGAGVPVRLERDITELLVTTFQDLRRGATDGGEKVERPSTVMSTAEAVAVATAAGLSAWYYDEGQVEPQHLASHLVGAVLKDDPDDLERLRGYFKQVVRRRGQENQLWQAFYQARKQLG